jgi:hypothetical protein
MMSRSFLFLVLLRNVEDGKNCGCGDQGIYMNYRRSWGLKLIWGLASSEPAVSSQRVRTPVLVGDLRSLKKAIRHTTPAYLYPASLVFSTYCNDLEQPNGAPLLPPSQLC